MPVSALQAAKRALVSLLLSLALAYNVSILVNRDSKHWCSVLDVFWGHHNMMSESSLAAVAEFHIPCDHFP